ncbi:hypothetical protein HY572_04870 [Candidatus Micrarchaeota archaeon]|nr:hypothetical protein [Candidatus Micrarchaeota archaeon]
MGLDTTTETAWMLMTFALVLGFLSAGPISDSPFVWAPAMLITVPFNAYIAFADGFPLLAPLFFLAFIYYFLKILDPAVGQGLVMFIVFAVLAVLTGL